MSKSMNRDMEKKRIVLWELSCRTASELPAPELPAAVEAVRLQSGSSGGVLRELNWRRSYVAAPADEQLRLGSGGVSSAPEKGIALPELRASAEFPPPELLVRWSIKS
ncbi:unnamed protein product [Boreogadus saida]